MKKVLIANRGEIAVRVIRAARELGIKTVAVYSDADSGALHVRLADEQIRLNGVFARDTYLNREKLLNAAIVSGADAVHPGYGFFSENPGFARAVEEAGLTFIGPRSEVIRLMADKAEARKKAAEASVPLVPGTPADATQEELGRFAREVGFPVIFKAVAGGSGRGMRVVRSAGELEEKRREAEAEALAAFQNGSVFLEKFLERPRHIEVQVFGDHWGNIVHFGERECSVQRRHQKIIEEAPAWNLSPTVREGLRSAALKLAQAVQYTNSGTVEFLVENGESDHGRFYFVEMNTRIQVEHPVTEVVTNTDLVKLQLQVARGERLPYKQEEIQLHGHAFEFRIYAENPSTGFSPTSGEIRYMSRSGGPWVREDGWAEPGTKISPYYDSLISKLIVSGATREEALARSRRALDECLVEGMETTLLFHRWFLAEGILEREAVDVYWIGREYHGERRNAPLVGPLRLPKTGEDPKITEDE